MDTFFAFWDNNSPPFQFLRQSVGQIHLLQGKTFPVVLITRTFFSEPAANPEKLLILVISNNNLWIFMRHFPQVRQIHL